MAKNQKHQGRAGAARRLADRRPYGDSLLAKALSHPTRVRILAALSDRVASAKDLELILGEQMTHLSYHCRALLKYGFIEVAKTEQIRGAVKTSYRATARMVFDDERWSELDSKSRQAISLAAVGEVVERAAKAIEAETFDRRLDRYVATFKIDADETAWTEIVQIMDRAYREVAAVEASAAARDAPKFRTTISFLSYESPEPT